MTDKPQSADGYSPEQVRRVRQTLLYVASKLGDLMEDVVVVGGLVPSLLVPQSRRLQGVPRHVGTTDLDLGLALVILSSRRYRMLTERLRDAGFSQDRNPAGRPTRQRWKIEPKKNVKVTVDFLMAPSSKSDRGGTLRNIERDFAALITEGLPLAFRDRRQVRLSGKTLLGERASKEVWVCGPAAFLVLKALAFRNRGENKDAYDIYYIVRNFGSGPEEVGREITKLLDDPVAALALRILREDFLHSEGLGPMRAVSFLLGRGTDDPAMRSDIVAFVQTLLESARRPEAP